MSEVLEFAQGVSPSNDRRQHARQRLRSITYAELDQGNGGIVLDASESGISVHAVVALTDDVIPRLRLKLPNASAWLETQARVVWTLDSGKVAGLQFEDLSGPAKDQIREWLSSEASTFEGEYPSAPTDSAVQAAPPDDSVQEARASIEFGATASSIDDEDQAPEELAASGDRPALGSHSALESADPLGEVRQNTTIAGSKALAAAEKIPATFPQKTVKVVQEPAKHADPTQKEQISQSRFLPEGPRNSAWLYFFLLVLAVVSLTSGWAAGRGTLRPVIEQFQKLIARADVSGPVAALAAERPLPSVNDIKIVDANGQRRTISLTGETRESKAAMPKLSAAASEPQPSDKSTMNFQVWTLSPPQRSVASGRATAIQGGAPPVVDVGKSPQDIAPVTSATIQPARPDAFPRPENTVGVLKRGGLIHRVQPDYPEIARQQNVTGTVILEATLGIDGTVRNVQVVSGPKLLVQAAVNAVKQWRYAPTLLDGKAIETEVAISLVFRLPDGSF